MSAQDRTLDQYHEWMQINAVSHLIRIAREVGLFGQLRKGQKTAEQLCDALSLSLDRTTLLLDALIAVGIVEKYGDDYALARAAHLLCQYDDDLGDQRWQRFADHLRGNEQAASLPDYFDSNAATQWIHTPGAMQAAEMLNVGGEGEISGPSILDLGCGSAVWSCAMAHRDSEAKVTVVDHPGALKAARSTAKSIGMLDRLTSIEGDPLTVELPENEFDIVVIAQRLHALDADGVKVQLGRAVVVAKPGGRVVVIDLFRGPSRPNLAEAIEAIKLDVDTPGGQMRMLEESESAFREAGLEAIQFSFLVASRLNLGLMVGKKTSDAGSG